MTICLLQENRLLVSSYDLKKQRKPRAENVHNIPTVISLSNIIINQATNHGVQLHCRNVHRNCIDNQDC